LNFFAISAEKIHFWAVFELHTRPVIAPHLSALAQFNLPPGFKICKKKAARLQKEPGGWS
jgi:hypothetical protein